MTSDFYDEAEADADADSSEQHPAFAWNEEGKTLKGIMTAIKVQGTKDGRINYLATIDEHNTDDIWSVWIGDSPFMLLQEFIDASPAVGSPVLIKFIGKQKTKDGTRSYGVFRVRAEEKDYELWADLPKQKLAKAQSQGASAGFGGGGIQADGDTGSVDPF